MTTALIVGFGVAAAAIGAKFATNAWKRYLATPKKPVFRSLYKGGFQQQMDENEAALVLGLRVSAQGKKIKEAHKRLMIINHPDRGGSKYIATKINEAKDILLANRGEDD